MWFDRSAVLDGAVYDQLAGGTTAIFEAMVSSSSKPLDVQTRYADDANLNFGPVRTFNFSLNAPNVVGGFNRIRVTICKNYGTSSQKCGKPAHFWRDLV